MKSQSIIMMISVTLFYGGGFIYLLNKAFNTDNTGN